MNGVDVLVLHYLNEKDEDYELKQVFWKERYSANTGKIVRKLISEKYIQLDIDLEKSLNSLKVPEIKEILKLNELKLNGNKKELINRIIAESDSDTYQTLLKKVWLPTDKGKKVLSTTESVFYAHKKLAGYLNVIDVYNNIFANKELSSKDILVKSINDVTEFNGKTSSYGVNIGFALWELSKVCRNYGNNYEQFTYLIKSCVANFINYREEYSLEFLLNDFDYFVDQYKIPSAIINDLKLSLSSNENFPEMISSLVDSFVIDIEKIHLFTSKDVYLIILASLQKDDETFFKIYSDVFKRAGGKQKNRSRDLKQLPLDLQKEKSSNVFKNVVSIFKRFKT
ncbi:SAP domain-containing protein [Carnobacterium pleistocenium]|uniref:SAP domain-containing protein n=1 Tax=Carnobacterium pleistocenium TaxID=181073 RepID=UPI000557BB6D|nr:SAP domain-containing protein [Carnobacterium pleistocenium]